MSETTIRKEITFYKSEKGTLFCYSLYFFGCLDLPIKTNSLPFGLHFNSEKKQSQ